jgi:hypothetical protein
MKSQNALANALKTHQSSGAKVEGSERRIDVVAFMDLANALGLVPSNLLKKLEAVLPAKEQTRRSGNVGAICAQAEDRHFV